LTMCSHRIASAKKAHTLSEMSPHCCMDYPSFSSSSRFAISLRR
jgi:hypothetical protein